MVNAVNTELRATRTSESDRIQVNTLIAYSRPFALIRKHTYLLLDMPVFKLYIGLAEP